MTGANLNRSATWSTNKRSSRDKAVGVVMATDDDDDAQSNNQGNDDAMDDHDQDSIGSLRALPAGVRRHQSLTLSTLPARHSARNFQATATSPSTGSRLHYLQHGRGNSEDITASANADVTNDMVNLVRRRSRSSTITMSGSSSSSGSVKSPLVSTTLQRTPWSPTTEEIAQLNNNNNSNGSSPAVLQQSSSSAGIDEEELTAVLSGKMHLQPPTAQDGGGERSPSYTSPLLRSNATLQSKRPSNSSVLSLNTTLSSEANTGRPASAPGDDPRHSPVRGPSSAYPYVRPIGPKQESPVSRLNSNQLHHKGAVTAAPGETSQYWQRQKSMIAGNGPPDINHSPMTFAQSPHSANFQQRQPNPGIGMSGLGFAGMYAGQQDSNQNLGFGNGTPSFDQNQSGPFQSFGFQNNPNSPIPNFLASPQPNVWPPESAALNGFGLTSPMTRPTSGYLASPSMPSMLPTSPSLLMPTSPNLADVNMLARSKGYNPVDFDCHPRSARFCVIKSFVNYLAVIHWNTRQNK